MISSLVFLAAIASPIAYGATYDCGPGYVTFVIDRCSGGACDVTYRNPGQRAYHTRWNVSQVRSAIGRGCHPAKTAQDYRSEAARDEAAANALLAGKRRAGGSGTAGGGSVALGKYECYTYSDGELEAAMALNFTLYSGGRYVDFAGHPGTWSYSGGYVTMHGTGLNGQRLKYTPGTSGGRNPAHLMFSQGDSCDDVG